MNATTNIANLNNAMAQYQMWRGMTAEDVLKKLK